MIRIFAGHRTAANLLMILFLVMGIMAVPSLRRETLQQLPIDEIEVSVLYRGATPGDVEDAICGRIEDAIDGIENIEEVRSEALEGLGRVTITLEPGTDPEVAQNDIQSEVDAIDDFPELAESAIVRQLGRTQQVAAIAVVADAPLPDLKAFSETLKDRLLAEPEIAVVEVGGFSDHQLRIEVSASALLQFGINATDIARTVARQSVDQPVGTVDTSGAEVVIRMTDERRTPAELEDLVVVGADSGAEIRLGQIARVVDVFEREEERYLFDGSRAALIEVRKTSDQDTLTVVETMKRFIARENAGAAPGTRLVLTRDQSSIVSDRLRMLTRNAVQGVVLVFACLWLFFHVRLAFWVAMSLPVSFLGGFFFIEWLGYSLNMLTMVGLLLAIGLLMDDGIVIAENIAVHRSRGKSALRAATDGASEVAVGVLSSFATTIAIFGPLCFLQGDLGVILAVMPAVLIIVLCVSLVEAFLILPGHLAHSMEGHDPTRTGRMRRALESGLEFVRERVVGRLADAAVRHRYLAAGLAVFLLLLAAAAPLGGLLKFQVFPEIDGDVIEARILLPQGTPLARTEGVVDAVVGAFERVDDELAPRQPAGMRLTRHVSVQYNVNADAFESGAHLATVTIDLLTAETRDAPLEEVFALWRKEVGALPDVVSIAFTEPALGPAGRAIEIEVSNDDLATSKSFSTEIQDWLRGFAGVSDVFDDLRPGKPEIRVRLREGAMSLGLTAREVADQLRSSFLGFEAAELQIGPESYEVMVRFADADRDSEADLESFHVSTPSGDRVPLTAIATLRSDRTWSRIVRRDGRRVVTVYGSVDPSLVTSGELLRKLDAEKLPDMRERFPGVAVRFRGEAESGAETGVSIARGLAVGLVFVYVVLSFQFRTYIEPLIVMAIIPMCMIGVVGGHLLMGLALTLPSIIGFASLAGIVVNDSILLVTFIKRERREGATLDEAARKATRLRFRAVLLTSATTIAGMTPLLLEQSLQAQILIPLTTSIVFGLLASTVLVLFLVPALYVILADFGLTGAVEPEGPEP